jgi:hypothetical protein
LKSTLLSEILTIIGSNFQGGQGGAPTYAMSLEERDRNKLRDAIRDRLPIREDGTIQLKATAWAVKGVVN